MESARRILPAFGLLLASLLGCQGLPTPTEVPALPAPPAVYAIAAVASDPPVAQTLSPVTPSLTRTAIPDATAPPTQPATRIAPSTQTDTGTPGPSSTPVVLRTPSHDLSALNEYQRGIAYVSLRNGAYRTAESDRSLDLLFATGANYISLLVTWYQTDSHSTDIHRTENTPADDELAHVINYAHAHGVHILLKPQVDFTNDPDHWRGEIAFDSESEWPVWFRSYREFILYYANLAQKYGVEEFSVGTELVSASRRPADWRAIIREVRATYTGLMTYSANHSGEEVQVQFWDALDFIGVNNFYHLTNYRNPTVDQLLDGWYWPILQLTRLHARFPNQPIIFTEVGYPSLDRANVWPWNWQRPAPIDLQEQADLYEALFRVWWKNPERPWFRGLFIWNWLAKPDQGGPDNADYTPHNKPAEQILKRWFAVSDPIQP